jgi:putative ABC transport system ATP-binding protein
VTGLVVDALVVEYRTGAEVVRPLDGLCFEAATGRQVLLLGPSGSGKTTLLSCLAGILTPTSGKVVFDGVDVAGLTGKALTTYRRDQVGIIFQGFNLVKSLTAAENVAVPLWAAGWRHGRALTRAHELLGQLDLGNRARHRPGELSGGQQQRVAIARALAHDPPLLLADEPTAHLDFVQAEGVLRILRDLANAGRVVVIATHDARILPLADGVVDLARSVNREIVLVEQALELGPDDIVFKQGDEADLIYVVEEGQVRLTRTGPDGQDEVLVEAGPGDYFGELGPLLGFPRSATATATMRTVLSRYDVVTFRQRFGTVPSWGELADAEGPQVATP